MLTKTGGETMADMLAFSLEQASQIAGVSERRLRDWDQTNLFSPCYASENRRRPYSRVYSFRDIVGLRTLALLRNKYRLPTQELQKVSEWLREHYNSPWSELVFYVMGKQVFSSKPAVYQRPTMLLVLDEHVPDPVLSLPNGRGQ
jgi:DNA-binding transcriptional MerR regulator